MVTAASFRGLFQAHLFSVFVLAILAVPARLCAQANITGEWEVKMDQGGRESFGSLTISKKADGTFAGKWGTSDLSDVKFDGQKLTFVRTIRFGDQEFQLDYAGTLKDGSFAGTISSDRGSFTANASRRKPKNPILGRWDIKFTIGDRDIQATLAVSEGPGGAIDAKWTSATGEHTVSNVKLQDGKLTFSRKSKIGENEFESTYEGTAKENKLTGTIKSERGDIPANGERLGAALIGKWELTTTTDRGTRTSILTVFSDLTGRYESFGGELPFKDLKFDGSQAAFSVEAGFGDQTFAIDFKAKLDGNTLKGEVTSARGTREVTGKKLDAASALVGAWEIVREGRQGTRTVKLVIKDDMTGAYTDRDSTVPVTDLRFDGGQLSFKVVVKFGEREVPMEFKGTVDGTALKGQFITERGAREATGKKVTTSL